ncbi:hypothetical protein ABZV78_02955 [Micromonospora sp. NPDC004540]|uniref:hypothetical protein n=1 Tax=Micromonospora sp. NPDC004540 TaxID=3154457 RepID=UPI0033B6963C
MTDTDDFLVSRKGRAAFVAVLMASLVVLDAIIAGLAAVVVLTVLTVAAPDLLQGLAPVAGAWRIATVLAVLEVAYLMLLVPFVWRRGLGELIKTGRLISSERPIAAVLTEVWAVLERAAAAGIVFAWQLRGPAGVLVLSTAATTAALVAARVLFRRWLRLRDRQRHEGTLG